MKYLPNHHQCQCWDPTKSLMVSVCGQSKENGIDNFIFFKEIICLLTSVVLSSLLIWLDDTHFPFDYNGKRKGRSRPKPCGPMLNSDQPKSLVLKLLLSLWHSQPVINFKRCLFLFPQIFSASSLMNLGVMLSVRRWRRCCMWLMAKSQSHSRNASLRFVMHLFSCYIYKKKSQDYIK